MTGWIESWFQSWVVGGGLIDTIITITVLEVLALWAYQRTTKCGLEPRDYLLNVASGLCLMLALRSALGGGNWYVMALFLLAAGMAHVTDLVMRLKNRH